MDKYEYLTDEDLGYKREVVERATFEYSPLGQALKNNKAKSKRDKIVKKKKRKQKIDL